MQRQYVLLSLSRTIQGTEMYLHLRNLLEGTMHHKITMEIHREVMEDHHQLFQLMMEDMVSPNSQPPQQEVRDTKDNRFHSYGNYSNETYYYRMMNTSEGDRKCCCGCCTNRQCASCLFCCECCVLCCECCMCCLEMAG